MTQTTEMVLRQADDSALAMPVLSIDQMIERRNVIVASIKKGLLKEGHDYGTIPGTGRNREQSGDGTPNSRNNTLLKPGAEKLCTFFGLVPEFVDYRVEEDWERGLFYYAYRCRLMRKGQVMAEGIGSANSRERKYRRGAKACPECGVLAIKRGKRPKRGAPNDAPPAYYCEARSGGCGKEFDGDDPRITEQAMAADPMEACDQINTLQKMAQKRSLIAATLLATNASEFFTQDVEDMDLRPDAPDDDDAGRDHQQRPQGRQPRQPEAGPNLAEGDVFMAEWRKALAAREPAWTAEQADLLIAGILNKRNIGLQDVNVKGRTELLAKARDGTYDKQRERVVEHQQQQQGGGEKKAPETQPAAAGSGKDAAPAKDEAAAPPPPTSTEEEVASWDKFLAAAREAAGDTIEDAVFERGIGLGLTAIGKTGKGETTTKVFRRRWLEAIRANAFDWATGKTNQVVAATAQR